MKNQLDKLLSWYEALTPETLGDIGRYYADDAYFRDPFNKAQGIEDIRTVFRHMFDYTEAPRFIMKARMLQGEQAFVTWVFEFRLSGKRYVVEGASHLSFNDEGLVLAHRDYWDAAEELLQKLPVVGWPIRWLRQRLSALGRRDD
jgi:nuclear transport factor 2 (NTF2) superfamily protein